LQLQELADALARKDSGKLAELTPDFRVEVRQGLNLMLTLYGGPEVLQRAGNLLPQRPLIHAALNDLSTLGAHVRAAHPAVGLGFDLADLGGNAYYSGMQFSVFAKGAAGSLLRGGRYDEVGAVFGRNRPAVGFSLDVKNLAALVPVQPQPAAIRAPGAHDADLRAEVRRLRDQGETVVCVLPGHDEAIQEFHGDRELVFQAGGWQVVLA
jgi:ATP phosphoribosyltransferase regulatory subunit